MKPAVHTLTYDQAVNELVALCDSKPSEADTAACARWRAESTERAQQLEAWIMMKTPKALPEDTPAEDAPTQHLEPLPEPAKEKHVPAKKTPGEKLQSLADSYHVLVDKLQEDPTNRRFRDDASTCKSRMSSLERDFHLTRPELRPIPSIKMGRPAGGPVAAPKGSPVVNQVLDQFLPTLPAAPAAPEFGGDVSLSLKRGPGPYQEPTAEDLRALLPAPSTQACQLHLREALRTARRGIMRILVDLEALNPLDRRVLDEDVQSLDNLVQTAVIILGEPAIPQAG